MILTFLNPYATSGLLRSLGRVRRQEVTEERGRRMVVGCCPLHFALRLLSSPNILPLRVADRSVAFGGASLPSATRIE